MRTRRSPIIARRVLKRGDKVAVRFVTDIYQAKVVKATRSQAVVNLYQDGKPSGEALLRYCAGLDVQVDATPTHGAWRLCGLESSGALAGLVFNNNFKAEEVA